MTLDGDKRLWPFPEKSIPIEAIEKSLQSSGSFEVQAEQPKPFDGSYTLLDPSGGITQKLEVAAINRIGDELAFVAGKMYLAFPKGDPAGGIESLVTVPGTRILLHSGGIIRGKKLVGSALSIDILLKNIDGKDFFSYQVTVVGPDAPLFVESH